MPPAAVGSGRTSQGAQGDLNGSGWRDWSRDQDQLAEPNSRARLLRRALQQLAGARDGGANVVFLSGDPGMGKTWLLDRIADKAEAQGSRVLRGGALEAEGMPPYLPFLEALGAYVQRAPRDRLQVELGPGVRLLAGILPEIELKLARLPRGPHLGPEQARLRLFDAVAAFLRAIASSQPMVLLLDDLQWADPASLELLVHVARRNRATSMLIVGAYRSGDAADNAAFQRAVAELGRQRLLAARLDLPPLSAPETHALGEAQLGGPLRPELTRSLWEHSEGNPFVAEELLRGWLDAGHLLNEGGDWRLATDPATALPRGITAAVAQRLARLEARVAETLRVSAVLGRTFDVRLLAWVLEEDAELVEQRLLSAAERTLLHAPLPGTFRFAHDTIREYLYARLPSTTRQRYHEAAGLVLERQTGERTARQLAELAFHFARSADNRRALRYAWQAADRAMDDYAFQDAVAQYQVAASLVSATGAERGDILLRLGRAALLAGAGDLAESAFREARSVFEAQGDRSRAAQAAHGLGQALWRREALAGAQRALEDAVALTSGEPSVDSVRILLDLADLRGSSLYHHQAGLEIARRAHTLAGAVGDRRLQATAARTLGRLHVISNDLPRGLLLLEAALETALAERDLVEAAETYACLANAYQWAGQTRRSLELTERRVELAREARDEYQLRHVYSWASFMASCLGEWSTADAALDRQEPIVERMPGQEPQAFLHVNRGYALYVRGEAVTAKEWLERGLATYRSFGTASLAWHLGLGGLCDLALGDRRAARANLDEQEGLIGALPPESFQRGCALATMARAAAELHDTRRAAAYYPPLLPFVRLHFWFQVDLSLGLLALCLGDDHAAAEHLERGRASAAEGGLLPELGQILVAQAELALRHGGRGSSQRARELLGRALAIFGQLGITPQQGRVRAALRTLPTQPGVSTSLSTWAEKRHASADLGPVHRNHGRSSTMCLAPAGLTSRELAVLRRVAAGQSNREIASELALSQKTVANHLTAILNKIGADNRAAAAAFAVRHNLA